MGIRLFSGSCDDDDIASSFDKKESGNDFLKEVHSDKFASYKQGYADGIEWSKAEFQKLIDEDYSEYDIIRHKKHGSYIVAEIKYRNCTNYEGRKILLYKCNSVLDLMTQETLDPHFSKNKKYHSPIARFEPTESGWNDANDLATYKNECFRRIVIRDRALGIKGIARKGIENISIVHIDTLADDIINLTNR